VLLVKSDPRDFCLLGIRHPKKLSLASLYKDFQNIVRKRKKDYVGPFGRLYFKKGNRGGISPSNSLGGNRFASMKELNAEMARRGDNSVSRRPTLDLTSGSMNGIAS
jgi:hypothetical protein